MKKQKHLHVNPARQIAERLGVRIDTKPESYTVRYRKALVGRYLDRIGER